MDPRDLPLADEAHQGRPIVLSIDLNEIPSPPQLETPTPVPAQPVPAQPLDVMEVVRRFHGDPQPFPGQPAPFPGETGVGPTSLCVMCSLPETWGGTVVCDGCERGFHLSCVGFRLGAVPAAQEWVCDPCARSSGRSKRWPSGPVRGGQKLDGVRLLDINASPPSDGDGEGSEEMQSGRMHAPDEDSSSGISSSVETQSSDLGCPGNVFDPGNEPGMAILTAKSGLEELVTHGLIARSFEDAASSTPSGGKPISNFTTQPEMFLHALRDYILERQGVLGEGWYVEFKQSTSNSADAIYCSPDGKKFESMPEVAYYLGLVSNCNSMDIDNRSNGTALLRTGSPMRRRRRKELARLSRANSLTENQDGIRNLGGAELSSGVETLNPPSCDLKSDNRATEASLQENSCSGSHHLNIDFPVQYEDFFLLCLGEIDLRPTYHNGCQIWPVGYKSCWHDKITGSIFNCEVSDGGIYGPVFKVRRSPCMGFPVPIGSTVFSLHPQNLDKADDKGKNGGTKGEVETSIAQNINSEEDYRIEMLLSDYCPSELDVLSCLGSSLPEASLGPFMQVRDVPTTDHLPAQFNCLAEKPDKIFHCNLGSGDEIGEFFIEGRSCYSVWMMVSHTLVNACREIFKRSGRLQFVCIHDLDRIQLAPTNSNREDGVDSLSKFCSSSGPVNTPRVIWSHDELETWCQTLAKWLDQDRFGLDIEFVQDFIEHLPRAHACSQYEVLSRRSSHSTSQMVGRQFLAKRKREEKDALGGLDKGSKKLQDQDSIEPHDLNVRLPPPGRRLSNRLPAELVGDVVEVCESLWRFYEILGLKVTISFEELEQELTDPWFDGPNFLEKLEKEIQEGRDQPLQKNESVGGQVSSPPIESVSVETREDQPVFIQVETGCMKDAAQAKVASRTYGRCTGLALTKAHTSLLKVLVGELQSKVAAFVDPNFDAGESKSKRGRKKDVDIVVPMKTLKIDVLPINELTWPELARRYILAFLAMDGNLDSVENASRESGKVFRCLQGDGGVLCGSLAGVAGMEADALLLAEAEKQIFGSLKTDDEARPMAYKGKDSEAVGAYETIVVNGNNLPEWAQLLEPVRKLPTNVGTRIRKCIYDALEKGPPEWARKILEHSISKEVYKGNASGPTKKAVLSVLAELCGESVQQKPSKGRKGKGFSSVSDIIMKQCRSILRRAAAADDGKVFANLLGTTLLNPNDNEDEGILGSSAMLSRPLDFRTIDLRLAAGAYGGSHEAFVEDVREVWHNIRTAYRDRLDLMELAESLSKNFESLYDKEVLSLVPQRAKHANPDCANEVPKKEQKDVACENEIPKAPWEEGVCKVCGIDRDDDSVLLCDTCDSEYHTYCLNPPLARIPEGNWYCPSCVAGQYKVQDSSNHIEIINRHQKKRHQKENTRMILEELSQLAAMMEEKEYWDLTIEERVFLLKFLCDEVLSSAVIRDHLDQCLDMSTDLQQKLRSLSLEWRSLKVKEDVLAARTAMGITSKFNGTGDTTKEGMSNLFANYGRWMAQPQAFGSRPSNYANLSADLQQRSWTNIDGGREENGLNDSSKHLDLFYQKLMPERNFNCNRSQTQEHHELLNLKLSESENQTKKSPVMDSAPVLGNIFSAMSSLDESNRQNKQPVSILPQPERGEFSREVFGFQTRLPGAENSVQSSLNGNHDPNMGMNVPKLPMLEVPPGSCLLLDANAHLVERALPVSFGTTSMMLRADNPFYTVHPDVTEYQHAYNLELTSLRKEISLLQESISSTEAHLLKVSIRREFLGRDSTGRLYWIFGRPGKRPWLVVGGSLHAQSKRTTNVDACPITKSSGGSTSGHSVLFSRENYPGSPNASSDMELHNGILSSSQWVAYESDVEIQELLGWLRGADSRERELKENIFHWQRVRLQQSGAYDHGDPQGSSAKPSSSDKDIIPHSLITSAATVLEKRYGPCLEPENNDIPKKRGKKSKGGHEERMYRCECMEPVWPSRYHCLSCHQTFCTSTEFDGHDEGGCNLSFPSPDDGKENESNREGKGMRSEVARETEVLNEADVTDAPKRGKSDFSSRLVKSQKGVTCPYDLDVICSKFVTNDSNQELVKEVGLLGSSGNVAFVPSMSPVFSDPTMKLIHTRQDKADKSSVLCSTIEHMPVPTLQWKNGSVNTCSDDLASTRPSINYSSQQHLENAYDMEPHKWEGRASESVNGKVLMSMNDKIMEKEHGQSCTIPEISLRPLVGKVSQILRRLKINLLDMDAALPEEALKPSKAQSSRRCAWRAYVKSSESIYKMIQATIIFENMIRKEYLKNGWWFWSSLTAAAKTSSISSLALRIYALDAAIMYEKALPSTEPTDHQKAIKSGKKKKKKKDADG